MSAIRAIGAAVLCCVAGMGRAAEPGLPAGMTGSWRMTALVCTTCPPDGTLPADLAGGVIQIGSSSFDDPLAGSCPEPHFAPGPAGTLAAFLAQAGTSQAGTSQAGTSQAGGSQVGNALPEPLRRLAGPNTTAVPVTVTCKPPPHARVAVGASVSLAFIAPGMLVRRWEDDSYIVLTRATAAPAASPAQ